MTIRDVSYVGEGLIPAPLNGPALRYTPLAKGAVTDIAVHHWTGFLPPATWTADEEIAYIIRIDQYHRTGRGLDGIGYQIVQFPSGRVYIVSRLDRYGAGVGGENNHISNIGLPGAFHINLPSAQQLAATVEAVRYIYSYLGREVPTTPHRAWGGTNCPGDRWKEWVPQLRTQAAKKEDGMATVKEITDLLNGMSHHQIFGKDMLLDQMKRISEGEETRAGQRHRDLLAAIKAQSTGGGVGEARVKALIEKTGHRV